MPTVPITIEVSIRADIHKVWDYWTSPEHIVNWNFASDDWHCPKATNELRVGGTLCATMAAKDGSMSFDFEGVYDEIIPFTKIAYSLGDQRKVHILFEQVGDTIKVTETFDAETVHDPEYQKAGWQAILNNFKKLVEEK